MFILTTGIPFPLSRSRFDSDVNPSQRLAEIRGKIIAVEARIRDLEALLTELILQPDADLEAVPGATYEVDLDGDTVNDITTSDANTVRDQLYRARAFEGELRTAEQFWNQIVQANKEAEKDTHDLFKRG